jgi:hypothetical protein
MATLMSFGVTLLLIFGPKFLAVKMEEDLRLQGAIQAYSSSHVNADKASDSQPTTTTQQASVVNNPAGSILTL